MSYFDYENLNFLSQVKIRGKTTIFVGFLFISTYINQGTLKI